MPYPRIPNYQAQAERLTLLSQLKHEYGAKGIAAILRRAENALKQAAKELDRLPIDKALAAREPDALEAIQALRPNGPRRIWQDLRGTDYADRLEGALLGRLAGCTLGAPVEFWTIEAMENLARENGEAFPPTDYWKAVPDPLALRYGKSPREAYTRDKMDGVPVDDDIAYTLLGLLVLEDYGPDFTVEDIGSAWLKYLPYACTAEDAALKNLKAGVPARKCAVANSSGVWGEWIGADIRSDPWAYMAPGWPERAADMAWRDAAISHRRQGIYGEMFFSAAIAAAFTVEDPLEALRIGLTEIPRKCALAGAIRWALRVAPEIQNYRQARDAMEKRFEGMHPVHTINNACLTVWGIHIGGTDFTRVIGETVAMGMDNDCTAATAGSIVGAVVGKQGIPARWHKHFNNTVYSYLTGKPRFAISALLKRFTTQARRVHAG
jgi:ADP-ribosylglycohydrolase